MQVPDAEEAARRLACHAVVIELFARLDAGDIDGALELYADDAVFLGVSGKAAIRERMVRGMAPHATTRSRHVIGNLRAAAVDHDTLRVEYTAVTYTLDGAGPYAPRSVLDQVQHHRLDAGGRLHIVHHEIFGLLPEN